MHPPSQLSILLGLFANLYLSLASAELECAPEICSSCVPDRLIIAPGVGFDLGSSYGTVAVRFHNGSTINIAQIPGDHEYTTLMQRYHTAPEPRPGYSAGSLREELREAWSDLKRDLNKRRGLPASPKVGVLSSMLQQLRSRTEQKLGQKISSVGVTVPKLAGLYPRDVADAFLHVGLSEVSTDLLFGGFVNEPTAAFAGYGYGLCQRYTNMLECEDEEEEMRMRRIVAIEFSEKTLAVTLITTRTARSAHLESSEVSWDLGWGKRGGEQEVFWGKVTDRIRGVVEGFGRKVDTLVLLGDRAMEKRLLEAVRDALERFVVTEGEDVVVQVQNDVDPVFVAARGTAELAKRNQESPWRCIEPDYCRNRGGDWKPPESHKL